MADQLTPRSLYESECERLHYHVNTGIKHMLPNECQDFERIQAFDFSTNCLGRNGIRPLLAVIRCCPNLQQLCLVDNYLSNESVVELCDTLASHNYLAVLDLSKNPISHSAGKRLSHLVASNPMLLEVKLDGTLMNPGLARLVNAKAKENAQHVPASHISAVATRPKLEGLSMLRDVQKESSQRHKADQHTRSNNRAVNPTDDWYAMETIWNLANMAAPPTDGWAGLASVMALVRQDVSLASMY